MNRGLPMTPISTNLVKQCLGYHSVGQDTPLDPCATGKVPGLFRPCQTSQKRSHKSFLVTLLFNSIKKDYLAVGEELGRAEHCRADQPGNKLKIPCAGKTEADFHSEHCVPESNKKNRTIPPLSSPALSLKSEHPGYPSLCPQPLPPPLRPSPRP